ncbi:MAG: hypothetical protein M1829_002091 [Trizodia sp. TS-e1964]|nr:MAG: hypothetical protein M1829_002091 [Trizodia sp. TS-e1964]
MHSQNQKWSWQLKIFTTCLVVSLLLLLWWAPTRRMRGIEDVQVGDQSPVRGGLQWKEHKAADKEKANRIKKAMKRTFWKYRLKAWGFDDILPITGGHYSSRNGWGAMIVDSASTLAIMGLWEELQLSIDHIIDSVDFEEPYGLVDSFETTIRYIGGLTSVVDLIDHGVVPAHVIPKEKRDRLLAQVVILATKLGPCFNSPTGLRWTKVNFTSNTGTYVARGYKNPITDPARAGSNWLENSALSRITGDPIYLSNATASWSSLVWNPHVEDFPGIIQSPMDIITGLVQGDDRSWDSGHDSYYEYLIKAHILAPGDQFSATYRDRWVQAALSMKEHLISKSLRTKTSPKSHSFIGSWMDGQLVPSMTHLACFIPGNLLYGGRYVGNEEIFNLGLDTLEACRHTYHSTPTGIGPESFQWYPTNWTETAIETADHRLRPLYAPPDQQALTNVHKNGFWATVPSYSLRPEYLESVFYAWRLTGEQQYRDWSWEAFEAIERSCKVEFGYAGVENVMNLPGDAGYTDFTESFWAAETLKYLYMTFADSNVGNLDQWVFTTEGHPLKIVR